MRLILSVVAGVGAGLTVGGLLAFLFGACVEKAPLQVRGLGPFDGTWYPAAYCFLGAVLASVGAALVTVAALNWPRR
jgi:hypothetical protein